MSSLPETPSNKKPRRKRDYRFQTNGTACEWGELYHPHGYHPVHLGDVFNFQYRVIRKLGYGSYSTVWLAIDLSTSHYVALKVGTATSEQRPMLKETSLIDRLAKSAAAPAETRTIVPLLNSFHHQGPNGMHLCLVFAIMGPNAGTVLKLAPECQIGEPWDRRYPKLWAKRLLRDTLLGLQFLHSNNIVHGDLHLGNILFTVKLSDTQSNPPEILEQRPDEGFPLQRLDGKIDLWAPKYLLEPRALYEYTSLELDPLVKITDLGGAFLEGSPPALIVTPAALRAPEVILKGQLTRALDMWSFGCLVFEIITGHQLFHAEALDGDRFDETTNDEHLIQITETIQPLPEALFKEWRRVDSYYGPDGGLIGTHSHDDSRDSDGRLDRGSTEGLDLSLAEGFGKSLAGDSSQASSRGSGRDSPGGSGRDLSGGGLGKGSTGERRDIQTDWSDDDVDDSSEEAPLAFPQRCETLEKRFRAVKPDDINEQEEGEIVQLMRMVLQPDGTKRASAADLLQQSWFRE